jgi:hypothetical protein
MNYVLKYSIHCDHSPGTLMTGISVVGKMIGVVEEVSVGRKEVVMSPPHHAMIGGKNNRVDEITVVVEEGMAAVVVEEVEVAGKKVILKRWTGPSPQQEMNVLNMSYLVQAILASILTNMRTFPWRRRETTYQIISSV